MVFYVRVIKTLDKLGTTPKAYGGTQGSKESMGQGYGNFLTSIVHKGFRRIFSLLLDPMETRCSNETR